MPACLSMITSLMIHDSCQCWGVGMRHKTKAMNSRYDDRYETCWCCNNYLEGIHSGIGLGDGNGIEDIVHAASVVVNGSFI